MINNAPLAGPRSSFRKAAIMLSSLFTEYEQTQTDRAVEDVAGSGSQVTSAKNVRSRF